MTTTRQDCSTAPPNCTCEALASVPVGSSATTPMSAMSTTSIIGTTIQTETIEGQSVGTTSSRRIATTSAVAMPTTQTSDPKTALIGGIVGGSIALILIVGVIAFFAMRNRKAKTSQQSGQDGHSLQTSPARPSPNESNYDRINVPSTPNEYGDVSDVRATT